jgi:hypothetical protein
VWHPLRTRHWCCLFQHSVNLFQSKALRFWDKQNRVNQT